MLVLTNITKRYAAPVLRGINLSIPPGQIVALLGANGAGKSTLSRIIAGLVPADSGGMQLSGQQYAPHNKRAAEHAGVQIVQQELNLIPTLTVAENMFLNRLPHRCGIVRRQALRQQAHAALRQVRLEHLDPWMLVGQLGVGLRQLVEIAAALSRHCRVLILDEPTAALTDTETQSLFQILKQRARLGTTIIYISHRLQEIEQLADRSVVMRDGWLIADKPTTQLQRSEIVALMSGRASDASADATHTIPGLTIPANSSPPVPAPASSADSPSTRELPQTPVLRLHQLRCPPKLRDISLEVFRGECLGIAGLIGSGRTELLRCIFGADPPSGGFLQLGDNPQPLQFRHPRQAVQAGVGLVTEDRSVDGLMLPLSVGANLSVGWMDLLTGNRFAPLLLRRTNRRGEHQLAEQMMQQLQVHATGLDQPVGALSGGNQQKVVAGKWLPRQPRVLLLDEPTRGIDVASRERIYEALQYLKSRGTALVLVSSDHDELLKLCDRIAVLSEGRITEVFQKGEVSPQSLLHACFPESRNQSAPACSHQE